MFAPPFLDLKALEVLQVLKMGYRPHLDLDLGLDLMAES